MMGWGGEEILFEEPVTRNYPHLTKNKQKAYIQESHQTLSINNMKEATWRHIIIQLLQIRVKQKILNIARKKWRLDRRTKVNITADFLISNNIYKKTIDKYFVSTDIENVSILISIPNRIFFTNACEEKGFEDANPERIHHLQTHTTRNVTGNQEEWKLCQVEIGSCTKE